jgi:hypothetical protein
LQAFDWAADDTPFSKCPARQSSFTCSAPNISSNESSFSQTAFVLIGGLVAIVLLVLLDPCHRRKKRKKDDYWELDESSAHEFSEHSTVLVPIKHLGDGDSPYQALYSDSSSEDF